MKSMPGPVGVISNPASGHNRDHFAQIGARLDRIAGVHHICTHSVADIRPALQTLSQQQIGVLAINGGDGTASAILGELLESGLFASPPLIALLPGGTANMNAGDIGVRGSLARATRRFCQWCAGPRDTREKLQQRALLRLSAGPDVAPHYGMFLGGGAVIQGTEYAHREVHSRGLRDDFSLALSTLRTAWGVLRNDPRYNRHVTIDIARDGGEPQRRDALILAMSSLRRLAFGMRPFWGEGSGDIHLTLIEQHCSSFARTFFSIVRGRANANAVAASGYHSHNASSVHLTMRGKLNLDGEILDIAGPVTIGASQRLTFLTL